MIYRSEEQKNMFESVLKKHGFSKFQESETLIAYNKKLHRLTEELFVSLINDNIIVHYRTVSHTDDHPFTIADRYYINKQEELEFILTKNAR